MLFSSKVAKRKEDILKRRKEDKKKRRYRKIQAL